MLHIHHSECKPQEIKFLKLQNGDFGDGDVFPSLDSRYGGGLERSIFPPLPRDQAMMDLIDTAAHKGTAYKFCISLLSHDALLL